MVIIDPRPDLTEDSGLWTRLLALAGQDYPALVRPLSEMRQNGTRLVKLPAGSFALRPQIGNKKGFWPSAAAYKAKATELLKPHDEEVKSLLGLLSEQVNAELQNADPRVRVTAQLDVMGTCAIKSRVLNEIVYFARDERAAARVRGKKPSAVVYTLEELRVLVDVAPKVSSESLRQMHRAKKVLGGVIESKEDLKFEQVSVS